MRKDKINIWPLSWWYVIFMLGIVGGFFLLMIIGPFLVVLFENEPLKIFSLTLPSAWLLAFTTPIAIIFACMYLKAILWKVSFTKTHIIAPKIFEIQEKKVEVECIKILTCKAIMEGFFNYYFAFNCVDGKTRKMSIIRFSFKQMEKILTLIQERGGLQNQDIYEILDPLRIKKTKRNCKIK
jgi:hypothetical protein